MNPGRPILQYALFMLFAINWHKMFGFNIKPAAIVVPIIMLGARWVVKNTKFTKFKT